MWATPDARLRHGPVPRLQRVGAGRSSRRYNHRMSPAARDRHRRSRGLHRRGQARGQARLPRADPAVQAHVGRARRRSPELQPARVRSAVGGDPGRQPAGSPSTSRPGATRARRAATAAPSSTTSRTRCRPRSSRWPTSAPPACSSASRGCASPRSRPASAGWRGCSTPWTRRYSKHHFWVRPKLSKLPSEYFREHGFASFQEDAAGLAARRIHEPRRQLHVGQRLPASRGHLAALGRGHRAHDERAVRTARGPTCSASTPRASSASRCSAGSSFA